MNSHRILLLGGSGFIGRAVAEQLTARGHFVTVPTRSRERARHLLVLPTIDAIDADVHDVRTLQTLVQRHDVVINLIGILHGDFEREHVALPKLVAETCAAAHVKRLIHMSALHADANGPSEYLRSRGRGLEAVKKVAAAQGLALTVFQPSVVFGRHDKFLNMFASLIKQFPVIPLGSANAKFQPVWVEDVARAIAISVDAGETIGKSYPLVGPNVYALHELINFVATITGKSRVVIGLGKGLSMLQATVFEYLPGKLITRDNVRSMSMPSTSDVPFPAIFGNASPMETIVSGYMRSTSGRARYQSLRDHAGRVGRA
jgi:NADH dehydrogenase